MTDAIWTPEELNAKKEVLDARKEVPRPLLLSWGIGLMALGLVVAILGGVGQAPGVLMFAVPIASAGVPFFLFGCVVKAIRDEGAAIRLGVKTVFY